MDKYEKLKQERLKELLDYNPESGEFIWKMHRAGKTTKGSKAGSLNQEGYIQITVDNCLYSAHRLAAFYMTGKWFEEVDHINNVRSDNKWSNLREASRKQNALNTGAYRTNRLGIKHVHETKYGRYQVIMSVDGKNKYFGTYDDLELAELVAIEAADKFHGEFAKS